MRPAYEDAVHIALGDPPAGSLRLGGSPKVLARRDSVTIGLCDVDPARHRELRIQHWRIKPQEAAEGLIGLKDFGKQLSEHPSAPIVLWTAPIWSERCHLWWTLDALATLGIPRERIWKAEPRGRHARLGPSACSPESLRAFYDDCVSVSAEMAEEGSALWRAFASPSPLGFDEARRRGSGMFPELRSSAEAHLAWFPWQQSGRLRLSDADALLLGSFGADWRTPTTMVRGPRSRAIIYDLMSWVGDRSLLDRLDAWRNVGVIEARSA